MSANNNLTMVKPVGDAESSKDVKIVVKKPMRYKTFKRLLTFAKNDLTRIVIGLLALGVNSATNLSFPWILGHALDRIESGNECEFILSSLGFFAVGGLASWVRVYCLGTATDSISNKLRKELFNAYMNKDINFFTEKSNGELLAILEKDVQDTAEILTDKLSNGLRSYNSAVNGSILLFMTSPKLTGITLGIVPLVGVGAMLISKYTKKLTEKLRVLNNDTVSYALERFASFSTIRLNNREDYEKKKFAGFGNAIQTISTQRHSAYGGFMSFINMSTNASLIAVLRVGGQMIHKGEITAGILARFAIQSAFVGLGFSGLSTFYSDLMRALDAAERIFSILDEDVSSLTDGSKSVASPLPRVEKNLPVVVCDRGSPTSHPASSGLTSASSTHSSVESQLNAFLADAYSAAYTDAEILKKDNAIEFVDVNFTYKSRPDASVLSNFSLLIKPNQITVLLGKSGSGKSTILSLLSGLYSPSSGYIRHSDVVVSKEASSSWCYENVGVVEQSSATLLSGTIAENIEYGKAGASLSDIETAAREASAHDFIMSFPKGYQTEVGVGGSLLSGGQRARIAIARALIKDPLVLLLDEATAALDEENEQEVIKVLKRLSVTKSIVVVTHSEAVKRIADTVFTIEEGRVVENK